MKKIASIGCGALGTVFARALKNKLAAEYDLTGVLDLNAQSAAKLAAELGVSSFTDIDALLASQPEIVVEIAGVPAARAYAKRVLQAGCDLVIVSVGALSDAAFKAELEDCARSCGRKVYVPNGALGGLDLMQTASLMGLDEVVIDNVKAPESLNGAPYLNGRGLPADREELVFDGGVNDAIAGFPKNVNVAVATALASEFPATRVLIKSVPGLKENRHIVFLRSASLDAELRIYSRPDPDNPKSSSSAAWSVIALLKNLASPLSFF